MCSFVCPGLFLEVIGPMQFKLSGWVRIVQLCFVSYFLVSYHDIEVPQQVSLFVQAYSWKYQVLGSQNSVSGQDMAN